MTDDYKDPNFDPNDEACWNRYLAARSGNEKQARKMLDETIAWRKSYFPLNRSVVESEANGKTFVSPHKDRDGRTIVVMRNRLENSKSHEGNVMHLVYQMERAVRATQNGKWDLIIDFEGYSLKNAPPLKTSKATLSIMQNHYPERLHRAYLVCAPLLFSLAFKAVSPFVDPVTRQKIVFLKHKEDLMKHFDASSIEKSLGGTSDYVYDAKEYLGQENRPEDDWMFRGASS